MSTHLTARERFSPPNRLHDSRTIVDRRVRSKPVLRCPLPSINDDEEIRYINKAVIWMVMLAMAPLILFHIVTFFVPDILLIPATPR